MINYICVQPDKPMFIWQLKVLLTSMFKLEIPKEKIHFVVLLENTDTPSQEMKDLEQYANVYYYKERSEARFYAASSKPYLYGRFFEEHPHLIQEDFFYVESDMLIYRLPQVEVKEGVYYWSNASKYLETDKYEHMLGYPKTAQTAFGFHCIGKGIPAQIWFKIEKESEYLYKKMIVENPACNVWICEMRVWMWNMKQYFTNEIHPELLFNDGVGFRTQGASVYHQLAKKGFYKKDYRDKEPFDINLTIDSNFALSDYVNAIKEAGKIFKKEKPE